MKQNLSLKRSSIILLIGGLALIISMIINDNEVKSFLYGFGYALIGVSIISMIVGFIRKLTAKGQES